MIEERIEQLTMAATGFDGVLGVAARDFASGREIMVNADLSFPTASTFKVALLYACYRQIDAGAIDPMQRIVLEDRHLVPGSGVLQDLDTGASLTVRDLATLMIVVSDNTATDLLYDLVGRPSLAETLAQLGLSQTFIPQNTREHLAALYDADPAQLTYAELRHKLAREEPSPDCAALRETPDNDISTPRDMLHLLEHIHRGTGLSAASREQVIDTLKRQKFNDVIPALLPRVVEVAHKTGSIPSVRNDVGIVYAAERTYGVALMTKRGSSGAYAGRLLADVSRAIYDELAGQPARSVNA